ncbi:MAG: glycosyltransferase family 2 protein, partial [Candidatus Omnitrophica bacterium]|nr:glycosyltransferase family 2 protein [Candidatus Omnitrophota bacterium]
MEPLVSIIIPAYNAGTLIGQTIESALGQTYKSTEIILVNDGSTDNTRHFIEQYTSKGVMCIHKENGGPASARNRGFEASKGDYIAFLDADDIWEPEKLAKQIVCFKSNPAAGLVYTAVNIIDEHGQFVRSRLPQNLSGMVFNELFQKNHIAASSVMVRRECFTRVGGFDEDPEMISVEDYDLWLRMSALYEVAYINEPLIKYRLLDNSVSKNIARSYLGELKVVKKNYALFHDRYPAIKPALNKHLSRLYFEFGYDYFEIND